MVGFFAAFAAANELPALAFLPLLFCLLLFRHPRETLFYFVPAAVIPFAAVPGRSVRRLRRAESWLTSRSGPMSILGRKHLADATRAGCVHRSSRAKAVYLFHMTLGHHGSFRLTPIFLFAALGAVRLSERRRTLGGVAGGGRWRPLAWLTAILTIVVLAFYTWNPKARNYGGSTQGLPGSSG